MQSVSVAALQTATWRAVGVGLLALAAGLVVAVLTAVIAPWPAMVATVGYLIGAALIGSHWRATAFGMANAVTLTRLVGTCWVGALTVEAALDGLSIGERLLMIGLATSCLLLDGVDGRVARARHEVSLFGARFDMETDALLLLCLSLAVPILGVAGWWTVAIAGLRYGYLVSSWVLAALRNPLTYGIAVRKTIAVIGGVSLVAALAVDLLWPGRPATVILLIGLGSLCWSFGRDIIWQARRSREQASSPPGVR